MTAGQEQRRFEETHLTKHIAAAHLRNHFSATGTGRCINCGTRISLNKIRCLAHYEALLLAVNAEIERAKLVKEETVNAELAS